MFRPTDPQGSLLRVEYLLGAEKVRRLEKTWAKPFREQVLPLIKEERFAQMYCVDNGAPNKSLRTLVGLHLLKDQYDLTDEETLTALEWHTQWHYALDVVPDRAHVCRKTMHNFRARVLETEQGRELFDQIADGVAGLAKIDFGTQRTDSTHIVSNMMLLNRLGLFVKTIEGLLFKIERMDPKRVKGLPEQFYDRYLDRRGYFADSKSSKARRRLDACAKDVYWLLERFKDDRKVCKLKQYQRLQRLFAEQCKLLDGCEPEPERVALKDPGSKAPEDKILTHSMQSPADEDATYGHKGKGYEAQITETCSGQNPFQVITDVAVTDSCQSDHTQTLPTIERLEEAGRKPQDLLGDAGYIDAENIKAAERSGVNLIGPVAGGPEKNELLHLHEFELDEADHILHCPVGTVPHQVCTADKGPQETATKYSFDRSLCQACHLAAECPVMRKQKTEQGSNREEPPASAADPTLTVTEKERIIALRKQLQNTSEFKQAYKARSGIEATNSELKSTHGARKLRVRGRLRVELSLFLKTSASNVKRFLTYALSTGAVRPEFALATG